MSTRSATNKRTQERDYAGAARKSAASAKPARVAASSVRVVSSSAKARRKEYEQGESLEGLSKAEKKARKQELRAKEDRMYSAANILMKGDEEYRDKRRVFWVLEGVGIVGRRPWCGSCSPASSTRSWMRTRSAWRSSSGWVSPTRS